MIEIIERSTIETKGFELNFQNNPDVVKQAANDGRTIKEKSDQDINRNVEDLGKYPVVYIDGVMIQSTNIKYLQLNNDEYLPIIRMEFNDPTNNLLDDKFPKDNSIISIFKESTNKDLMAIKMDFKITDFTVIKGTSGEQLTYQIEAVVDVDDFYLNDFESYKGKSFDILKKLSLEMKLGFASNITSTNDEMVWINPSNYRIEFMKEIIENSYISDDTFLFGYLDFYYNFNLVDIEKQLNSDISEQNNMLDREEMIKDGKENLVPLILTNNPDEGSTNMHIDKYTLINSSTNVNLSYGYKYNAQYYNKSDDQILNYSIDSISNDTDNTIVLKGNDTDKPGNFLYDNMVVNTYLGKIDSDNAHKNYLHSKLQNKNNLKYLQKLKMKVKMSKVNYGLYRFQKVLLELYNMGKLDPDDSVNKKSVNTASGAARQHDNKIINKLSGEWLITAINIRYDQKEGNIQEITLVKRELTDKYNFPRREKIKDV
ncbi:hypothetical protein M0Q97_07760 [Candidatus Dojkabacteria bacterium]|jgi:hypothetical protein|nr:hypothetical protein [Candidatus Dojkabacteria bacterium]